MLRIFMLSLVLFSHMAAVKFHLGETSKSAESSLTCLNILLVDCDSTCLAIASKLLHSFGYEVMTAKRAHDALCILRERENEFNLILTEVQFPDMDRYELLEAMRQTSSLPIVILSAEGNGNAILGGLFKGAEFYLVKPMTVSDVKNLWQFSYMKKMVAQIDNEGVNNFERKSSQENMPLSRKDLECQSLSNARGKKGLKGKRLARQGIERDDEEDNIDLTISKKPKMRWTKDLHGRFMSAINLFGIDHAQPKKILKHMKVPGLKARNVSSHLQKYRLSLKRDQDAVEHSMIENDHPSSTFNLPGGSIESLEPQLFLPPHQPESGSFQSNLNCPMSIPSHGCGHLSNNVGPSHNNPPIPNYCQLDSQRNMLYPTNSRPVRLGCTNNGQSSMFSSTARHRVEQRMILHDVGNSGHTTAVDCPVFPVLSHHQQLPQFAPPSPQFAPPQPLFAPPPPQILPPMPVFVPPPPLFAPGRPLFAPYPPAPPSQQNQEEYVIFEAERGEIDELFDMEKESPRLSADDGAADDTDASSGGDLQFGG